MAWVLTFDGQVYREADLTIDEAEQIEALTGATWRTIHPTRSAKHAKAILQTLLMSRAGLSSAEASAKAGSLTIPDFLDLLSDEEEDADLPTEYQDGFPPSADGTTTPT